MLKKVLKYDLRAVFRIWWIVALISVGLAVLGGFGASLLEYAEELPFFLLAIAGIVQFLAYFSMLGLILLTQILIFIRFYKNFFTDEGYLTFTLPVKRETLFNSKVITGFLAMAASVGVCLLNLAIMLLITFRNDFSASEFLQELRLLYLEIPDYAMGYILTYCLEGLVALGLIMLYSVLFLYCCITFGSMLVKKAKLAVAIGVYYGASSIFTTAGQLMAIFSVGSIAVWLESLSERQMADLVALALLMGIVFLAMLCALIYAFTHWMLDRKLNLS